MDNPFEVEMLHTDAEKAWQPFIDKLMAGKVSFQYKKKDNSLRDANGTLCPELIPDIQKTSEKKQFDHTQNYYDIDAMDWRCFIKGNFISIKQPQ